MFHSSRFIIPECGASHKLNSENWLNLLFGTRDRKKCFHAFIIACGNGESGWHYRKVAEKFMKHMNDWSPWLICLSDYLFIEFFAMKMI